MIWGILWFAIVGCRSFEISIPTQSILRQHSWRAFADQFRRNARSKWPPEGVDVTAVWTDSDSGPLGRVIDALAESQLRAGLIAELGTGSFRPGYAGIIDATNAMTRELGANATMAISRRVLRSLFPNWPPSPDRDTVGLLYWFKILFAAPFPEFSAKMCSLATYCFGHWLMGPLEVVDVDGDEECIGDGRSQLIRIRRCRFLEESACASVCVNACKMPTQAFFSEDMGVPVRIVPDYETLGCEFQFGVFPSTEDENAARSVACFSACPYGGALRIDSAALPSVQPHNFGNHARCSRMDDASK